MTQDSMPLWEENGELKHDASLIFSSYFHFPECQYSREQLIAVQRVEVEHYNKNATVLESALSNQIGEIFRKRAGQYLTSAMMVYAFFIINAKKQQPVTLYEASKLVELAYRRMKELGVTFQLKTHEGCNKSLNKPSNHKDITKAFKRHLPIAHIIAATFWCQIDIFDDRPMSAFTPEMLHLAINQSLFFQEVIRRALPEYSECLIGLSSGIGRQALSYGFPEIDGEIFQIIKLAAIERGIFEE